MMAAIEKINREIKTLRENIQRGIGGYEKEGKKAGSQNKQFRGKDKGVRKMEEGKYGKVTRK